MALDQFKFHLWGHGESLGCMKSGTHSSAYASVEGIVESLRPRAYPWVLCWFSWIGLVCSLSYMTTIFISLGTFSSPEGSPVLPYGRCHFSRPLPPAPNYLSLFTWCLMINGVSLFVGFCIWYLSLFIWCVCEQVCVCTCMCLLVIFKTLQAKATFLLSPYLPIWSLVKVSDTSKCLFLFISVYVYSNLCECIHAYLLLVETLQGIRSLGTGITGATQNGSWDSNFFFLEEQYMLLPPAISLAPTSAFKNKPKNLPFLHLFICVCVHM